MIKKCYKLCQLFLFFFIFNLVGKSENIVSPINGISLNETTDSTFSFLIAGHIHGDVDHALYSATSFIVNIDSINKTHANFLILGGDMIENGDSLQIQNFIKTISSKINIPIFNAAGNHDVLFNRSVYEGFFGKTFYDFNFKNSKFLILDTEYIERDQIVGDQLTFFKNSLKEAKTDKNIKVIFIVTHKLIWFVNFEMFQNVFKMINSQFCKFKTDIEPLLLDVAKEKPIYWISGDGGFHLFYHHDSINNITFISNGLHQRENDAIIKANVNNAGKVSFKTISLTGKKVEPLEFYNVNYWKVFFDHFHQPFADPETQIFTIPAKILAMLDHKYFWAGAAFGITCLVIILVFLKKLKI